MAGESRVFRDPGLLLLLFGVAVFAFGGDKKSADDRLAMKMIVKIGDPFSARATQVRPVSTEERVGFSKTLTVYHVSVSGPDADYSVYCVKKASQAGRTYTVSIDYLDGSLSWLHLWPEEKKNLNLPPGQSTRGRAYRMMVFQNVTDDPRMKPDLACDIKSETPAPSR